MSRLFFRIPLLFLLTTLFIGQTELEAQDRPPYSLDQLVQLLRSGVFSENRIQEVANRSCLSFRVDKAAESRLSEAGASQALINHLQTVCVRLPAHVTVTPETLELTVGGSELLKAEALGADSVPLADMVFRWSSDDTSVARVTGDGRVLARQPGETRVKAAVRDGPVGLALVRVTAPVALDSAARSDSLAALTVTGKSVGTAAALGFFVPGGGEFYTGKILKGAAVLLGSAGAMAAGLLLNKEDTLSVTRTPTNTECDLLAATCEVQTSNTLEIKETDYLVVGAGLAGALWLYALVDGIRSAKKSRAQTTQLQGARTPGISLELAPADGVRLTRYGDVELTFIRVRP